MIKPTDVKISSTPDPKHVRALEEAADEAIRQAERSGHWPAVVSRMRMPISTRAVETVADEYRAQGWIVDMDAPIRLKQGSYHFTIDHPDRER